MEWRDMQIVPLAHVVFTRLVLVKLSSAELPRLLQSPVLELVEDDGAPHGDRLRFARSNPTPIHHSD